MTRYVGTNVAAAVPPALDGLPVTTIGPFAFSRSWETTDVTIPDSVLEIGSYAFYGSQLVKVRIPDSVVRLGAFSFASGQLRCVSIGSGVVSIGDHAFDVPYFLKDVAFFGDAPALGADVFGADGNGGSSATIFRLPERSGWTNSFGGLPTSLLDQSTLFGYTATNNSVVLTAYFGPDGAVNIPSAVSGLPVTGLGDFVFAENSGITSVTVPASVVAVGDNAFLLCSGLTNVDLGEHVSRIGFGAFAASALNTVTIPKGVTFIGGAAFDQCNGLTRITVDPGNPVYSSQSSVLFDKSAHTLIRCPGGFKGGFAIPDSVAVIGWDGVGSIGGEGFFGCAGLTSVTIPSSVRTIGPSVFRGCTGLTSVIIPDGVTNIGVWAFYFCPNLTNVTIGNGVARIGNEAFSFCPSLRGLFLAGDAPAVGDAVFAGDDLARVYFLPGATSWDSAFAGLPADLWHLPTPRILRPGHGFAVQTNPFSFTISWATNVPVVVDACTDLVHADWKPVSTNILVQGAADFVDTAWRDCPARFYRLRSP